MRSFAAVMLAVSFSILVWPLVQAMQPPSADAHSSPLHAAPSSSAADFAWLHDHLFGSSPPLDSQHALEYNTVPSVHRNSAPRFNEGHDLLTSQGSTSSTLARPGSSRLNKAKSVLIFDPELRKMVKHVVVKKSERKKEAAPKVVHVKGKRIDRPKIQSWKDDYPKQIIKMTHVLAKHIGSKRTTAYRLLSRYGNHEIANGLLSNDEDLQKKAALSIPLHSGRIGARKMYLGDQAEEITERYRKMHGLTKQQAYDKLGTINSSIGKLLRDPATFEETARSLAVIKKGEKKIPASSNAVKASSRDKNHAEESLESHQHPHLQQQPQQSPLVQSIFDPAEHFSHVDDDIDFDAIVEFVNRNQSGFRD
jgi:hypothetical protein